jgi:type I restriction enzyme M protein
MTNQELANRLWEFSPARLGLRWLKAADYAIPVLGLIFLTFANNIHSVSVKNRGKLCERFEYSTGTENQRNCHRNLRFLLT